MGGPRPQGDYGGQLLFVESSRNERNLVVSKPKGEHQLSEDSIREELSKILESSLFA